MAEDNFKFKKIFLYYKNIWILFSSGENNSLRANGVTEYNIVLTQGNIKIYLTRHVMFFLLYGQTETNYLW